MSDASIEELLEMEPYLSTRQIAERLHCSHVTVDRHLQQMGKVWKLGAWLPHQLSESQLSQRVSICCSLLSRYEFDPFLDRLVTGDEKWVCYVNVIRKHQWVNKGEAPKPCPKPEFHAKKLMLCVWWTSVGILHWEILPKNTTVTAAIYADPLSRVQAALIQKQPSLVNRKGVILLHDNARPHVAKLTHAKIVQLQWEVLPHAPYSPDLAPSNYHLFRSLRHPIKEKMYAKVDDIESDLNTFFASKSSSFYKAGIQDLVQRWQQVVASGGQYISD